MVVDGAVQTYIEKLDETFASPYINMLYDASLMHKKPKKALVIGLGGGALDRKLRNVGVDTMNVDIDPEIVKIAKDYFGFKGEYAIADGRRFLRGTKENYDLVYFDVFNGFSVYPFMFSKEAFELAKARMDVSGILAMNVVGEPPKKNGGELVFDDSLRNIHATLGSIFENVYLRTAGAGGLVSYVFYASDSHLEMRDEILITGKGKIITDDRNTLDYDLTGLVEKWRAHNYRDFLKELPLI